MYYLRDVKNGDDWRLVNEYIPRNVWDFSNSDVDDTETTNDIPILQKFNSSSFQLWVELPTFDNLQNDRVDVHATEVYNVDDLVAKVQMNLLSMMVNVIILLYLATMLKIE